VVGLIGGSSDDGTPETLGPPATDDAPADTEASSTLPAGSDNKVLTAEGFVDSVGVGVHVSYLDTSYGDVDAVELVKDLGVRHVRDGLGSTDSAPIKTMQRFGEVGIHVNWVAQPEDSSFTIADQMKVITDNDLPVESVEGANERDNHGDGNWAAKLRAHQGGLFTAVKANLGRDVPVVAPSLVHDESRAELGEVPSDVGNAHPYTGGEMQTTELTERQLAMSKEVTPSVNASAPEEVGQSAVVLKDAMQESGAMYATELGFHTATDSRAGGGVQPYVSEPAQAVLELQQLLANYRDGIDRSYIYELLDEGDDNSQAEDRFGLVHADGSPKPVYTALKNLLAEVRGTGATTTADSAPVNLRMTGGSDVTTSLTLPRADGSTVVAIWEASPVWDPTTESSREVGDKEVTLHLGTRVDAQVYAPIQQAKAVDDVTGTSVVQVTSGAAPTVVVLTPTRPASTAPKGVGPGTVGGGPILDEGDTQPSQNG